MSSAQSPLKIAIIGAGPAGLTLARLLQINEIPCTVYEAEPDRHSRNQGGSLDLHPEGGQLALKHAGLLDEFQKHARPEGECMRLLDNAGNVLWDENVTGPLRPVDAADRPEIDRTALRDLLLDSLQPDTVRWSHKITHVEPDADGGHTLHFSTGTTEPGIGLLIGGDGAFSKIRPLVTDVQPIYSGITIVELWKHECNSKNPWLDKHLGAGSCFMFDQDRALMAMRQSNNAIRAYAAVRKPLSWSQDCGIDWADQNSAQRQLVEGYFGDCGEDIKRTILETDDNLILRHAWMLPVGLKWQSKPGVTLIGDAAHLMTPFAGVGVNVAMVDALDLANELIARKKDILPTSSTQKSSLAEAVSAYEANMFPRAEKYAKKTWVGLEHHFRASGGHEWAERFRKHTESLKEKQES